MSKKVSVQTPAVSCYAVTYMSCLRVWEVHLLQVHGFCFLQWNPGRLDSTTPKVDSKVSYCCQWSALALRGGYHSCDRTARRDFQSGPYLLLCQARQLQVPSPAVRFAPGQLAHWLGDVSGACPILLTATGAIRRSKPREVTDLVSQSFAVSLWPQAAKC